MSPITVPVVSVTLGGTDIAANYVGAPKGGVAISWQRGTNFDGSSDTPGSAVVLVDNSSRAFNTDNASSPLAAVLGLNKVLRITAVYSATTYYLFHGFVIRIVPRDDQFVEIHATDPLWWFKKLEASTTSSFSRNISSFRGLILDALNVAAGERNFAPANGPEAMVPFTGADHASGLAILNDLNAATGSFHYIKPTSSTYQYTVRDRTYLQSNPVAENYSTTDLTKPFPVISTSDENIESIINEQRVTARSRQSQAASEIWGRGRLHVNAGDTRTIWADWGEPAFAVTLGPYLVETDGTAPSVVMTHFSRSAKLEVTGGTKAARLRDLNILGRLAPVEALNSQTAENSTSITAYGRHRAAAIESDFLSSEAHAGGLAKWIVRRFRVPRPEPTFQVQDRFPSMLQREIGERVTLDFPQFSWAAGKDFIIRSFKTEIYDGGYMWQTTYQLQFSPDQENLFTIGGTADQGVGGTSILGF